MRKLVCMSPQHQIYWRIIPLIIAGVLLPSFAQGHRDVSIAQGTLIGHVIASAAWLALGPLPFVWRLPGSILWPATIYFTAAEYLDHNPHVAAYDFEFLLAALWVSTVGALWMLQRVTGWRLRLPGSEMGTRPPRSWQYDIRGLLIITAIIAGVLGTTRVVFGRFLLTTTLLSSWKLWLAQYLTALTICLAILAAALRPNPRWPWIVIGILLVPLIAAGLDALFFEFVVLGYTNSLRPSHVLTISAIWVALFAATVRSCGYQLRGEKEDEPLVIPFDVL